MKIHQLTNHSPSQMMGYVVVTEDGRVAVIDGGCAQDADALRRILAREGGHVDLWLLTHPHYDHCEALMEILKDPRGISADGIYCSRLPDAWAANEPGYAQDLIGLNAALSRSIWPVNDLREGQLLPLGTAEVRVLRVSDPDLTVNAFNNASCVFRLTEGGFSFLVTGDLGAKGGERLLRQYGGALRSTAMQMAHHGQRGVTLDVYRAAAPEYAFWPTPRWLWENTLDPEKPGQGPWDTLRVRRWMEQLGAKPIASLTHTTVFDSKTGTAREYDE